MGRVRAICTSREKGTAKERVHKALLREDHGIVGDAHAGKWHRQVSLLSLEEIEAFRERGADVEDGAFGENLIVEGVDTQRLCVGDRLHSNDVLLEVTQLGKECHSHCRIHEQVGECIMPKKGIFCRVLKGGLMEEGDEISCVQDGGGHPER